MFGTFGTCRSFGTSLAQIVGKLEALDYTHNDEAALTHSQAFAVTSFGQKPAQACVGPEQCSCSERSERAERSERSEHVWP